jgi:hypothetical protein
MKTFKKDDDIFWQNTRLFVEDIYKNAWMACRGTLLAPPLFNAKDRSLHPMKIERHPEDLITWLDMVHREGTQILFRVNYLDNPPPEWICDL